MKIDQRIPVAAGGGPVAGLARKLFGDDGFDFGDLLDLVNPLQHIPVVGKVYRELTGDTIAPGIRVAGGALFGGPLGAAFSLAGLAVEGAADAASATSPAPPAAAPRGGWLLAAVSTPAASAAPVAPEAPAGDAVAATAPPRTVPRGGWLLAAAYASAARPVEGAVLDTRA